MLITLLMALSRSEAEDAVAAAAEALEAKSLASSPRLEVAVLAVLSIESAAPEISEAKSRTVMSGSGTLRLLLRRLSMSLALTERLAVSILKL